MEKARTRPGGFALFMEQRTGKTFTSLLLAREWPEGRILVICPKVALSVWNDSIPQTGMSLEHFDIINFESFISNLKHYLRQKYIGLIVDESHRIKNRSGEWAKAVHKVSANTPHKLILTGTWGDSGVEDLFSQLKVIDRERFDSWKDFAREYLILKRVPLPDYRSWRLEDLRPGQFFEKVVGTKNLDKFEKIMQELSVRVKRSEVATQKTQVRRLIHRIDPSKEMLGIYRELEEKLFVEFRGRETTTPLILVLAVRLQQLCGGFLTSDDGIIQEVSWEKRRYLEELIRKYSGEPMVIVARYHPEITAIRELCQAMGKSISEIHGKSAYDPKARPDITILQPQSGVGIDLSYSKRMIIFSQDYSYINWSQFMDRIVQVDTPEVFYHYILMEGLMDEIVYSAVAEKCDLMSLLNQKFSGKGYQKSFN